MIFGDERLQELERRVADLQRENTALKQEVQEFRSKEQTISNAIMASMEHAKQLEASKKKLYNLDIQRSRLLYLRMEQIINDLYRRYPELRKDSNLRDMSEKFKTMVFTDLAENTVDSPNYEIKAPAEDPIKKLLKNIIVAFDNEKKETQNVKTETVVPKRETTSFTTIPEGVPTFNFEKKSAPAPAPTPNTVGVSSSGFDLNEALHPTMELEEIMKVFNLKDNKSKK